MSQRLYPLHLVLPHRPPMVLIDEIVSRELREIEAVVTVRASCPFFQEGRGTPAYVALEWMAQVCAAFGGSEAMDEGRPIRIGFLLGTRDFQSTKTWFGEGERLRVRARLEYRDHQVANFACTVAADASAADIVASASVNAFQSPELAATGA
jgi:predicted hotdog family 3-hydroxylacyl-ACP dehydratase